MKWFHDGPTAVLEALRGWGSGANYPASNPKPSAMKAAKPWTHTMEDTSHANGNGYPWRVSGPYTGNQAANTRVQQRDIQLWWLLSDGRWVLGSHVVTPGDKMYPLSWGEGSEIRATSSWRDESANGGGASMLNIGRSPHEKYSWHTWGKLATVPSNAIGAATAFYSRLILNDPKGPDDRHLARILSAGSGDWWKDEYTSNNGPYVLGQSHDWMGYGRLKYVTRDWQLFSWTNLSEQQIRANPPPFINMPN